MQPQHPIEQSHGHTQGEPHKCSRNTDVGAPPEAKLAQGAHHFRKGLASTNCCARRRRKRLYSDLSSMSSRAMCSGSSEFRHLWAQHTLWTSPSLSLAFSMPCKCAPRSAPETLTAPEIATLDVLRDNDGRAQKNAVQCFTTGWRGHCKQPLSVLAGSPKVSPSSSRHR